MNRTDSKLLTLREAANMLGVQLSTLRAWRLRRKHLPFITVGAGVRVSAEAIEKFIEANTIPPREETR